MRSAYRTGHRIGRRGLEPSEVSEDPFDGYTTYYASASASGGGAGTIGDPWTITEAVSNATAGDRVYLRGGTYNLADELVVNNPGTSDVNRVVFQGYPNEAAHLVAASLKCCIACDQNEWLTFYELEFSGFSYTAIAGSSSTSHTHNGEGVNVYGCYFHDAGTAAASNKAAVNVWNSRALKVQHCVIDNNEFFDSLRYYDSHELLLENNLMIQRFASTGLYGIFIKRSHATIGDNTFRRNEIRMEDAAYRSNNGICFGDSGAGTAPQGTNLVYENLIISPFSGYAQVSSYEWNNLAPDIRVYNNTIVNCEHSAIGWLDQTSGFRAYNNILGGDAGLHSYNLFSLSITECDYNFYDSAGSFVNNIGGVNYTNENTWQDVTGNSEVHDYPDRHGLGDNSKDIFVNPLFTNRAGGDYTLQAGSPCKNAGKSGEDCGCYIGNTVGPKQAILTKWGY